MNPLSQIHRCGRVASDLGRYLTGFPRSSKLRRDPASPHALRTAARNGAILIVDAELPRADRDAGSRILETLLRSLVEMGLRVYFMPAAADRDEHYVNRLTELGVQPLPAPQSQDDWRGLQELAGRLDFVWLCRPLVAIRYLNFFRRHSTAQLQYYAVDLHFVREERRYRLTGKWSHWLRSKVFRALEYSVIARADAALSLSHEELAILAEHVSAAKLRWVPPHVARPQSDRSAIATTSQPNFNLIFVGNFRHAPNDDAVRWLLQEIWPRVRPSLAGAQLHIVGASAPVWLRDTQTAQLHVHENVSDPDLAALYAQATVALVPLRFGAGVKGKVLEAMEQGVPLVSTSIGLEGLPATQSLPGPCDSAEAFAAATIRLATDERVARDVARRQRAYLDQHFSPSAVREQLCQVLAGPAAQTSGARRPTRRAQASV